MPNIKWVKYKDMGGPVHRGAKKDGKYLYEYKLMEGNDEWGKIMGVIADCEGRYDTVVMYDGTGVTFGAFQWTLTSGRLQGFLTNLSKVKNLDWLHEFGMGISNGYLYDMVTSGESVRLLPNTQKKDIVKLCIGHGRKRAVNLCEKFAILGSSPVVRNMQNEYMSSELTKMLYAKRKPLHGVGGSIAHLLPYDVGDTPIHAIFFNLFQNLPGGAFVFFMDVMKTALDKGLVRFSVEKGYHSVSSYDDLLMLIWEKLCKTSIANWGFGSKRYLKNKDNLPRVTRLGPAVKKYYAIDLPLVGE